MFTAKIDYRPAMAKFANLPARLYGWMGIPERRKLLFMGVNAFEWNSHDARPLGICWRRR